MALKYFHINTLASYVMDAWQKHLELEDEKDDSFEDKPKFADPTSAKYLVHGPKIEEGDNKGEYSGGLLGDLEDELVTDLVFEEAKAKVFPAKVDAAIGTHDNRAGKGGSATLKLKLTTTKTSTAQHSTTHSIKTGVSGGMEFGGKESVVRGGFTISFEYAYSWTDSTANSVTHSEEFWYEAHVDVPKSEVHQAIIIADKVHAEIPYSAQVRLTGTSEANFPKAVQDPASNTSKKNHSANAGEICSWIEKHGSAGWKNDRLKVEKDAMSFEQDPDHPEQGIASLSGTMNLDQQVNFTCYIVDVTGSYDKDPTSEAIKAQLREGKIPKEAISQAPVPVPEEAKL